MVKFNNATPLILLAAGGSTRMERPKALLTYRGRCWAELQLQEYARAGGTKACLVIGPDLLNRSDTGLPWLMRALSEPTQVGDLTVRAAINWHTERGSFSSLQLGLAMGGACKKGAFVLPIDVPVRAATYQALDFAAREQPEPEAFVAGYKERRGHPVLLSRRFARSLVARDAGSRLDHCLEELGDKRAVVQLPYPEIKLNLNTPEAWRRWLLQPPVHESLRTAAPLVQVA